MTPLVLALMVTAVDLPELPLVPRSVERRLRHEAEADEKIKDYLSTDDELWAAQRELIGRADRTGIPQLDRRALDRVQWLQELLRDRALTPEFQPNTTKLPKLKGRDMVFLARVLVDQLVKRDVNVGDCGGLGGVTGTELPCEVLHGKRDLDRLKRGERRAINQVLEAMKRAFLEEIARPDLVECAPMCDGEPDQKKCAQECRADNRYARQDARERRREYQKRLGGKLTLYKILDVLGEQYAEA